MTQKFYLKNAYLYIILLGEFLGIGKTMHLAEIINKAISFRHELHKRAELAWNEHRTTRFIREELEKFGLTLRPLPGLETGGYVDIVFDASKPFIAFRSDLDALPLEDDSTLPYCSETAGICHACGHDFHTAVGMAIAILFHTASVRPHNNIRIIFQPAEEPIPSGAFRLKDTEILDRVKTIFAIHVEPTLPVGTISFAEGWVNAQSTRLEILMEGPGGHSARPHLTVDLIRQATELLHSAYQFAASVHKPHIPAILTFTSFQSGEEYNIIPSRLIIKGTFRSADKSLTKSFLHFMDQKIKTLNLVEGLNVQFHYLSGAPPVVIQRDIFLSLKKIVHKLHKFGIEWKEFRSTGGDDFGWYLEKISGAIIRIGIWDQQNKPPLSLHQNGFNTDDQAIEVAIRSIFEIMNDWI